MSDQMLELIASHVQRQRGQADRRADGSKKGRGFLGPLLRPDGGVSTELSMGTSDVDGVERDIPTLVPTLSGDEVRYLLENEPEAGAVPDSIAAKAIDHARMRQRTGRAVFAPEPSMRRGSTSLQDALTNADAVRWLRYRSVR